MYVCMCVYAGAGLHDGVRGAGRGGPAAAGRLIRGQLYGHRCENAGRRPPLQGMYKCMYIYVCEIICSSCCHTIILRRPSGELQDKTERFVSLSMYVCMYVCMSKTLVYVCMQYYVYVCMV